MLQCSWLLCHCKVAVTVWLLGYNNIMLLLAYSVTGCYVAVELLCYCVVPMLM